MKWERYVIPGRSHVDPPQGSFRSDVGEFVIHPHWERGRHGRKLKSVVWKLYEHRRMVGQPFASAKLAKAFAEALHELGDDRLARRKFIREGAVWCAKYEAVERWREKGETHAEAEVRYDAYRART